ncbi:hypothetical protein F5Y17DRAFT_463412 [Xylariaceae sp. FL0594]|nr:hypothetical protein F5Y17DRAFT_463412 [Xylariaceae sp. FL0594]
MPSRAQRRAELWASIFRDATDSASTSSSFSTIFPSGSGSGCCSCSGSVSLSPCIDCEASSFDICNTDDGMRIFAHCDHGDSSYTFSDRRGFFSNINGTHVSGGAIYCTGDCDVYQDFWTGPVILGDVARNAVLPMLAALVIYCTFG